MLAHSSLVCRPDLFSQMQGAIFHPRSKKWNPEGDQLIDSGLTAEVVVTVLNATAPSMRRLNPL